MKCGLLLDVVVGEGAAIFELLAGEDQTLLIRDDALLVLDPLLDVLDVIGVVLPVSVLTKICCEQKCQSVNNQAHT